MIGPLQAGQVPAVDFVLVAQGMQILAWPHGMMAAFLLFVRQTTQARSRGISSAAGEISAILSCASSRCTSCPAGCVAAGCSAREMCAAGCAAILRRAAALVTAGEGGGIRLNTMIPACEDQLITMERAWREAHPSDPCRPFFLGSWANCEAWLKYMKRRKWSCMLAEKYPMQYTE